MIVSGIDITYVAATKGKRVATVTELGTDGVAGQMVSFDRSRYNTTVIQTAGEDDVYGNSDDLLNTYGFDDYGRTVHTETKTKGGVYFGGDAYSYTDGEPDDTGSNLKSINKVTSSAYGSKNVWNLLRNHSAEAAGEWTAASWAGVTASYTAQRTTAYKMFGKYSFQITASSASSGGGGSYVQTVSTAEAVPGSTYTLSGYVKTASVVRSTSASSGAGFGGCMAVILTASDGTVTRQYSDYVNGTSADGANNGWQRVSLTFTIPSGTTGVQVAALLYNATGTAYFDGLQLEEGTSANGYNMLENSCFEDVTDSLPEHWSLVNGTSEDISISSGNPWGDTTIIIKGAASVNKRIYQQVKVDGTEEDIYVASAWARAWAAKDAADQERPFEVYAKIYYSDGTSYEKSETGKFNRDINIWQKASFAFDLSDDDSATTKTPERIVIGLKYHKQINRVYFDNASLVKDVAGSYTYDEDGNIITTKESGYKMSSYNVQKI